MSVSFDRLGRLGRRQKRKCGRVLRNESNIESIWSFKFMENVFLLDMVSILRTLACLLRPEAALAELLGESTPEDDIPLVWFTADSIAAAFDIAALERNDCAM
jgi:hypothetical protein